MRLFQHLTILTCALVWFLNMAMGSATKNPHKMMIYFNKKMPNYFYCSVKKPIFGEKLIVKAVPIEKLCELNGTEVIPDDYKSDCYNDVDESKFACKEKYRIMTRHEIVPEFLSHTLQMGTIQDGTIDWYLKEPKFRHLVSYLAPTYIRLGGFKGNFLVFNQTITNNETTDDFSMSVNTWESINDFCREKKMPLVFGLNTFKRTPSGKCNTLNLEDLFSFSDSRNYSVTWQLGNEPDYMKKHTKINISPEQYAIDCIDVTTCLHRYPNFKKSKITGPDTTSGWKLSFLKRFINTLNQLNQTDALAAITIHHYYLNGRKAKMPDALDYKTLDSFKTLIINVTQVMYESKFSQKTGVTTPVWFTETGSAFGGGAPDISDRFIGCFLLLDKLGVAAQYNIGLIFRQALYKGLYALFDEKLDPNPDYWISVMFKRFVGRTVIKCKGFDNEQFRLYCHRDDERNRLSYYGLNIANNVPCVRFNTLDYVISNKTLVELYLLTADQNDLSSRHPLFPLLALLFERCEQATQSSEMQSSESFNIDIQAFIQHQERDRIPLLVNEPEIDGLMVKAIQVMRIHLLELEKVQELCKDFCHRYITCLKTKMQSENLLRSEYGPDAVCAPGMLSMAGSSPIGGMGRGNDMFLDGVSNGTTMMPLIRPESESGSDSNSPLQYHINNTSLKIAEVAHIDSQRQPLPNDMITTTARVTTETRNGSVAIASPPYLNCNNNFTSASVQQKVLNNYSHSLPVSPNASVDDGDDSGSCGAAELLSAASFLNNGSMTSPYTDMGMVSGGRRKNSSSESNKQKRGILPKHATSVMRSWLFQHLCHPYPTEDEKRRIAAQTNLTLLQVNNWFINARRRILQPLLDSGVVPSSTPSQVIAASHCAMDTSVARHVKSGSCLGEDDGDDDYSSINSNNNSDEFSEDDNDDNRVGGDQVDACDEDDDEEADEGDNIVANNIVS